MLSYMMPNSASPYKSDLRVKMQLEQLPYEEKVERSVVFQPKS